VFLLYVFLDGAPKSKDMYFYNVDDCVYFAQRLHKQGGKITAYCLPTQVNPDRVRVY
jgi:predicted enzyme related to lactoylglutathione lyase